jgi:membrane protease YdiL (CAAX protease family)
VARPQVTLVQLEEPTRRTLSWETTFVMVAFLLPAVVGAVVLFAQHVTGVGAVTRFPVLIQGHPLENMIIDIVAYLPTASLAPLALFLLARTGQGPRVLGLELPGLRSDVGPAIGIAAASYGAELAVLIPLAPLLAANARLSSPTPVGAVPDYYIILGLVMAAITAIAEEVLMNGYLMTRLSQLGWSPGTALFLGVALRTSYHVYYGIGFLATVPVGYFLTRSFQKHGRLTRPIVAHFLFDAVLITIAVLASH